MIAGQPPDLSVILPMYRNRDTVVELYQRLCKVLEAAGIRFELIFVDDACPQRSYEEIEPLTRTDNRVSLVVMEHNLGQNDALLAGFNCADGKAVASMDADLQDSPEALPLLYSALKPGVDVVFGGRLGSYESGHRLFTSRLYKWMMHMLSGVPLDAGLFFVATQQLASKLITLSGGNTHIIPMIGVLYANALSIPTPRSYRPSGLSAYSGKKRLEMGLSALTWIIKYKLQRKNRSKVTLQRVFPIKRKLGQKFIN